MSDEQNPNKNRPQSLSFDELELQKNLNLVYKPFFDKLNNVLQGVDERTQRISNMHNSFANEYKRILSDLNDKKIELSPKSINDMIELGNELKRLNNKEIPSRIEVQQDLKITSDAWTKKFYIVSPLIGGISFCLGLLFFIFTTEEINENDAEFKLKTLEVRLKGRNEIYEMLPLQSKLYLDKNYPNWRSHIEK